MEDRQDLFSPRRGSRQRKSSQKALESVSTSSRRRTTLNKDNRPIVVLSASDSESNDDDNKDKPLILHENENVAGEKMFTFQTRKRCESIIPQTVLKTPCAIRAKLKKDIAVRVLANSNETDFSDSGGSEYAISDDETESDATSDTNSDDNGHVLGSKNGAKKQQKAISKQLPASNKSYNNAYRIKTDDYFSNHVSKKILTSNHTLDKLETPRLPQDQLQKLMTGVKLSIEHSAATKRLLQCSENYFEKWMYLMHENINILLYGLGSKKNILDSFHEKCLRKLPAIVVNGFFPSLSIKDVLDGIILNLLELKENPANIYEACELIESELRYIPDTHLYLIVHNIDMVRNCRAQTVFARLSAISNMHLIASIDHINAPLAWDYSKLNKFNFTWWDVTTFKSYSDETSFESSMMVQRTGTLALSSLRNVFLSLTSNSKGIYIIIVKYQIENGKKQYYQGLAFKDLYSLCREAFLVSSDLALRAQLTEFVDHKMVKYKRSAADGTEYLIIPIANTVLQQFLSEHSNS